MKVETTDLRPITRDTDKITTVVYLCDRVNLREKKWLVFGTPQIRYQENKNAWELSARMTYGVTDFEHDSAYALRLPLIGLVFEGIEHGCVWIKAWVAMNNDENIDGFKDFHVPRSSDYNPTKHQDAFICDHGVCKENPHPMIPGDFYVPPFDRELYSAVCGRAVKIHINPVLED